MTYIIRPYQENDLDAVLSAWENASKIAHPFLSEQFLAQEQLNICNLYLPRAETWVTEYNQTVIGFISLSGHEVGGLFIQPAFQRKGVGQALMDKAVALHGDLEVAVFKANPIGCAFYKKYGFNLLEERFDAETGQEMLRLKLINKIWGENE